MKIVDLFLALARDPNAGLCDLLAGLLDALFLLLTSSIDVKPRNPDVRVSCLGWSMTTSIKQSNDKKSLSVS